MSDRWQMIRMIKIYVRGRKHIYFFHILSFIKIQVCELNIFRDYRQFEKTRRYTPIVGDGESGTK